MSDTLIKMSLTLFGYVSFYIADFFPDLSLDLKKAKYKRFTYEHISFSLFIALLVLTFIFPFSSFILSFFSRSPIVGFLLSALISFGSFFGTFFIIINYPKTVAKSIAKAVDSFLPFFTLNLSLLVSAKLPLDKSFLMIGRFKMPKDVQKEINPIIRDLSLGSDINTVLEKATERASSENFKELLFGILSLNKTGGDIGRYLKEKSRTYLLEYRRKLSDFARKVGFFAQIYLMAIIAFSIFLTVLLSIFGAISGVTDLALLMQFFIIVVVIPLVSLMFVFLLKSIIPAEFY